MAASFVSITLFAFAAVLVFATWRLRRRRGVVGPAAGAMMHELLSQDRRAAIEIILEERTGERDPEDRDGDLPQLENPDR